MGNISWCGQNISLDPATISSKPESPFARSDRNNYPVTLLFPYPSNGKRNDGPTGPLGILFGTYLLDLHASFPNIPKSMVFVVRWFPGKGFCPAFDCLSWARREGGSIDHCSSIWKMAIHGRCRNLISVYLSIHNGRPPPFGGCSCTIVSIRLYSFRLSAPLGPCPKRSPWKGSPRRHSPKTPPI